MFDYNICNQADRVLFYRQCKAIETHLEPLMKEKVLEDMDGTLVQKYKHRLGEITVVNDEQVGSLYVKSSFDLMPFF